MKTHKILVSSFLILSGLTMQTAFAQDEKPKFQFKPAGRVLLDGALFAPDSRLKDGAALPDIRLGGKATYGDWTAKVDVGFGYGKLSMKDVFIQYDFNKENFLRGGYFVHQFGLNAATSSSMKPSMEAPISDTYFNATGRNLGLMYVLNKKKVFLGVSAILAGTTLTTPSNEQGKVSAGGMERLVWRPLTAPGTVAQIGFSAWYQGASHKGLVQDNGEIDASAGYFGFSANYPTRVAKVELVGANVSDAKGVFKLTPELVLSKDRFALEAQYYYMNVGRKNNLPSYHANGAYGLLRGLLLGDKEYGYSYGDAGLATPGPKTLECVLGYNYTNANTSKAGIYGGITNDYSVTFNYYINKYVIARLRWSYTNVRQSALMPDNHVNIIQARIMFKF